MRAGIPFPNWAKILAGRAMVIFITLASFVVAKGTARRHAQAPTSAELDRTGILVTEGRRLPVLWKDESIIVPVYEESLAHSFWRAQEFSLFMQNASSLQRPLLDFGCGDGSFAAVLFSQIEYGVDIDGDALDTAKQFHLYENLVQSVNNAIPLPDASINSVFSNSVLEHVQELDDVIREIARVLSTTGIFVFTVPIAQLTRDLRKYFGRVEADRVNSDCYHRNLLELAQWRTLLRKHGLEITSLRTYQPDWFTFYYWMFRFFGNRGLGRFFPTIRQRILRRHGTRIVGMIRSSIGGTDECGGNALVVARKLPAGRKPCD
jgi:SAM-dependent methyltransferase